MVGGRSQQKQVICTQEGQNQQFVSVRRDQALWKGLGVLQGFGTRCKGRFSETIKLGGPMGRKK